MIPSRSGGELRALGPPAPCLASLPLPQATRRSVCHQTLSRHLIGMAAAQKSSTPLFPGRGNGISWRGLRVGGETPLVTRNTPHFQALASLSPSVFTPKFPGIALSTRRGAAASVRRSREDTRLLLWTQSHGPSTPGS